MKKRIVTYLLMVILFFIACGKREEKIVIEQPQPMEIREVSEEEIDEFNLIVEAIIDQNNLDVLKSDKDTENLLLEFLIKTPIDLNEIDLDENNSEEIKLPPIPGHIYISELIGNRFENKVYFTSEDSLYIMQQNTYPDSIKIAATILEKANTKENVKQKLKENPDLYFGEFEISIPILSKDRQTAYVELGYFCGALCGNGSVLILKKIHGKWKVVEDISSWIS